MTKYKATKNIHFKSTGKDIFIGDVIELEKDYAERVNKDLKLTFPDVDAVLVAVDVTDNVETITSKKAIGKKQTETDKTEDATE